MSQNSQIMEWISTWKKASISLNTIRTNELKNKNYYLNNRKILNSMLQYAYDKHTVRMDSGLIIQQYIFKQIYSQSMNTSR